MIETSHEPEGAEEEGLWTRLKRKRRIGDQGVGATQNVGGMDVAVKEVDPAGRQAMLPKRCGDWGWHDGNAASYRGILGIKSWE